MSKRAFGIDASALTISLVLSAGTATAGILGSDDQQAAEVPTCSQKIGALAVVEPDQRWWEPLGLGSPEALIKMFVNKSKCFTLLDRGKGMDAVRAERAMASDGDLQSGSNIGKGQVKAADYVLVPDLISKNRSAGGNAVGGVLGGMVGGVLGAVIGGINIRKKTADVMLTVTDVRSSEQVAMTEGHADKTDLGWGAGGGLFSGGFGAAGAAGYSDTEIGKVITIAYLDAYTKLVSELGGLSTDAVATSQQQAVTMAKPGRMYTTADPSSAVLRDLEPGTMLYPTGQKQEVMWEVQDELGRSGWVSSILFDLSK